MSYIAISSNQQPRFFLECSKHISDVLNTKIDFGTVADEYLLYSMGSGPIDKVVSQMMIDFLKEVTVNK